MKAVSAAGAGSWRPGLVLAAVLLLLGLPTLLFPYGRDQAMFAYVGQVWREGGLPYRDAWDVKLPGIYAVYALVGGAAWGPRLLDLLAVVAGAFALIRLDRLARGAASLTERPKGNSPADARGPATTASGSQLSPNPGRGDPSDRAYLGALLLGVFTFGALDYWNLAQTETLIGPLAALALGAGLSGRAFLAGGLLGAAVSLKTTAVLFILPVGLAVLTARQSAVPWRTRAVRYLSGAALIPLAFGLYFAARGGLPYLGELVRVQAEYAGGDPRTAGLSPAALIHALGLAAYLPLVLVSAVGLVPWLRDGTLDRSVRWSVALWWGIALLQIVLQRRFYLYHWSVLTPAAAFLAADGLRRLWRCFSGSPSAAGVCRVTAGIVGCFLTAVPLGRAVARIPEALAVASGQVGLEAYHRRFSGVFDYSVADGIEVGRYVAARSALGDQLLVLGFEPHVYLYAERLAPTRHASDAPLFGEKSIREGRRRAWLGELLDDLERKRPLYYVEWEPPAVIPRPEWAQPLDRLRFRYYREEGKYGRFRVYRRREGAAPFVDTPIPQG